MPVISLNLSGLDKNPGFKVGLKFLVRMIYAMMYGDMIVQMANQCRPYELEQGATQRTIDKWVDELVEQFKDLKGVTKKSFLQNLDAIADDFAAIPVTGEKKIRVGVVGEIYIKYSPLGNNNLEDFLLAEGCEPVVPGLIDFAIFKTNNRVVDVELYGGNPFKRLVCTILQKFMEKRQKWLIAAIRKKPRFCAPEPFSEIYKKIPGYLGYGNKMGEGWLLTGEMLELIDDGITNIVCTQPFGCLPNHIAGKGMVRAIKNRHPEANIVAIDYDPGATRINQENRIKLMLANARMMAEKQAATQKAEEGTASSKRETVGA